MKAKTDKCDYFKLRSFCTARESINKGKQQATEWEKVFVNHVPYRGLVSRIYKVLKKLNNNNNTNNPDMNRAFSPF